MGLPASVNDFPKSDVDAKLKIDAPDLPVLTAMLPDPLSGSVAGGGPIKLSKGWVNADLALEAKAVANKTLNVEAANLHLTASKRIMPAPATPFEDSDGPPGGGHLEPAGEGFRDRFREARPGYAQRPGGAAHTGGASRPELDLRPGQLSDSRQDLTDAARAPVDAQFAITLPKLEDFGVNVSNNLLSGRLESHGKVKSENGALNGQLELDGGDFQLGDFKTGPLTAKIDLKDSVVSVDKLTLQLNATDQIAISGHGDTRAPFSYDGSLLVDIQQLSALHPLLAAFGVKQPLAGALHLDWAGKGEAGATKPPMAPALDQSGQLNLALSKGRFDKIDLREIKIGGLYGPGFVQSTDLRLVTGPTSFAGNLEIKDGKLHLKDINLAQGNLDGLERLPHPAGRPGTSSASRFNLDERIAAEHQCDQPRY